MKLTKYRAYDKQKKEMIYDPIEYDLISTRVNMKNKLTDCHDCNAKPGDHHEDGCDVERCSVCGGQRIQCWCKGHDKDFARWTEIWPGKAEADYLGIDLNKFEKYKKYFL